MQCAANGELLMTARYDNLINLNCSLQVREQEHTQDIHTQIQVTRRSWGCVPGRVPRSVVSKAAISARYASPKKVVES